MTEEEKYFRACSQKGLVIDANLLVLLLVGRYKKSFIRGCQLTSDYSENDYEFIERLIAYTKASIIVTPHVLAEISNLTFDKMLRGKELEAYFVHALSAIRIAKERFIDKDRIILHDKLLTFGFADIANVEIAKEFGYAVLTEDGELFGYLANLKYPVLNLAMMASSMRTLIPVS